MMLFATTPTESAITQLAIAAILGALGIYWLLPRPRGRSVAFGTFAALASAVVVVIWLLRQFGDPAQNVVEQILFWLFSGTACLFATIFVVQRNPARGAIAFAFLILSVCGLFLLLAAPFLMAATIIIYASAIVVTFLFVLMLSHTGGPSDENDRTREPLLGSLAGFGFLGLVLFALYQGSPSAAADAELPTLPLPAQALTPADRQELLAVADQLRTAAAATTAEGVLDGVKALRGRLGVVLGTGSTVGVIDRLALLRDPQSVAIRRQAQEVQATMTTAFNTIENRLLKPNPEAADLFAAKQQLDPLREKIVLLAGRGELPARNVSNIGYAIYTNYLLVVEMVGTILLVATIGAVAIAGRKEAAA